MYFLLLILLDGTIDRSLMLPDQFRSMAWAEMKLIIAKMIWSFEFELADRNKQDWTEQKAWLSYERGPLWVKIKRRE